MNVRRFDVAILTFIIVPFPFKAQSQIASPETQTFRCESLQVFFIEHNIIILINYDKREKIMKL